MVSLHDVPANKLNTQLKEDLKEVKEVSPPEWHIFVKTGMHKERPPMQKDWWFVRAASILRTVAKDGPVGVSKLRSKYGGSKNRGVKRHKFTKSSGNIIRKILQQLEAAKLIQQVPKTEIHKGRILTSQGQSLLDKTANKIYFGEKGGAKSGKK